MTSLAIGFCLIGLLIFLVVLGMHIAYALFSVAFLGIWLIRENLDLAFRMLELTAYSGISDYLFATIPLFVLMGLLVSVSNVVGTRLKWRKFCCTACCAVWVSPPSRPTPSSLR